MSLSRNPPSETFNHVLLTELLSLVHLQLHDQGGHYRRHLLLSWPGHSAVSDNHGEREHAGGHSQGCRARAQRHAQGHRRVCRRHRRRAGPGGGGSVPGSRLAPDEEASVDMARYRVLVLSSLDWRFLHLFKRMERLRRCQQHLHRLKRTFKVFIQGGWMISPDLFLPRGHDGTWRITGDIPRRSESTH